MWQKITFLKIIINKMENMYSELDVTWVSIEKYVDYCSVRWSTDKNGIPRYMFFDEDGKKIDVNIEELLQ